MVTDWYWLYRWSAAARQWHCQAFPSPKPLITMQSRLRAVTGAGAMAIASAVDTVTALTAGATDGRWDGAAIAAPPAFGSRVGVRSNASCLTPVWIALSR